MEGRAAKGPEGGCREQGERGTGSKGAGTGPEPGVPEKARRGMTGCAGDYRPLSACGTPPLAEGSPVSASTHSNVMAMKSVSR